jgi:hypothetical protein
LGTPTNYSCLGVTGTLHTCSMEGYGNTTTGAWAVQPIPITDGQPWDSVVGGALRFVYEYAHNERTDGPKSAAVFVAPRVRVAFRGVQYMLSLVSLTVATGSVVMAVSVPNLGTVRFFLNVYLHPSMANGSLTSPLAILATVDGMWADGDAAFTALTPGAPVRFVIPRDNTDKFVFHMSWRLGA